MIPLPTKPLNKARPSSLNMGVHCRRYGRLAASRPGESNEYTSRGTLIHQAIALWYRDKRLQAIAAWPAICEFMEWVMGSELPGPDHPFRPYIEKSLRRRVGGVWIHGHLDLAHLNTVVDWKSGSGMFLPPVEQDWQMMAYGYLWWKRCRSDAPVVVKRVMVDERRIDTCEWDFYSEKYLVAGLEELVQEMAHPGAAYNVDLQGHCSRCLYRKHCPAYLGEAKVLLGDGLVDMVLKQGGTPDPEKIQEAIPAAAAVLDRAKEVMPKRKTSPRRKYLPGRVELELRDVFSGRELADMDDICSVSIANVERLLRDNLNYTREDLDRFWWEVEQKGGRIQ